MTQGDRREGKGEGRDGWMILPVPPAISGSATVKLSYLQFKQFPFINSWLFGQFGQVR